MQASNKLLLNMEAKGWYVHHFFKPKALGMKDNNG